MGVSGISVCFCVAYWIRSVQSRVDEVKQSLAGLVPERQKEIDVESAMVPSDWRGEEEEKLLPSGQRAW
ncbi:hypothetical protein PG997_006413 [Apiospora hydei]|uniref:Uncharacterized protein n=1 Tax=Apiospora hydei TaxID=1337664 RepID=A0ABR1WNQ0_9PEZI